MARHLSLVPALPDATLTVAPVAAAPAGGNRYARQLGSRCDGQYRPAAAIAADIRSDIKTAVRAGDLPGGASDYSVRCESYSMGQSITVTVRLAPRDGVLDFLSELLASYNWDGSDIQTDYFDTLFSGEARFEDAWGRAERERQAARRQATKDQPKSAPRNKAGLAAHLTSHHRINTRRANFDTLALWHGRCHDETVTTPAHMAAARHTDHAYESYGAAK